MYPTRKCMRANYKGFSTCQEFIGKTWESQLQTKLRPIVISGKSLLQLVCHFGIPLGILSLKGSKAWMSTKTAFLGVNKRKILNVHPLNGKQLFFCTFWGQPYCLFCYTLTNSRQWQILHCSKTDFPLLCSLMKFHIFHPRNVGLYCEGDHRSKVILCLRAFTAVNIELRWSYQT